MSEKMIVKQEDEMFEVSPYGVAVGLDANRPALIFRDKRGERIVPIYLSPVEAGIAVTQDHWRHSGSSPHGLSFSALHKLGVQLTRCTFIELKGHHQYVEVEFAGHASLKSLRVRADQAVSFCLHARVPFFCSTKFFEVCRSSDGLQPFSEPVQNTHPYLN